jgi:eukaryotic-like serine/threonine-protein kinase
VKRDPLTSEFPDSFDSLLRAAADVSDVPLSAPLMLKPLCPGASLADGRFRICRLIGQGGMGAVYEVEDCDTRARVALKVLNRVEPRAIKRFKDEFRILADTLHPRLVRLRDLFMENGIWFFTMDLIQGSTLSAHLARVGPVGSAERECELRRLMSELVDGVAAIHATGHLHRDLKPANVLVAHDGRLVIVDFGLVGDLSSAHAGGGTLPVVGTASHMAPEQARGEPATAASDWYAVGTIAYEALTGQTPFEGDSSEVLLRKRRSEEIRLFSDEDRWPADLVALCRGLLAPDPAKRPDHTAILRLLGNGGASRPIAGAEPRFVGRLHELATLDRAFDRAHDGALAVCRVSGAPGIGKTALVREFLRRAASERSAVVLCGRCYEREATPFKLLDGLVDSLSESIARHVPAARTGLSPLGSLFPGLETAAPRASGRTMTDAEARSRAVHAFRTGLTTLASVGTVILHVDDVHWCDADGVGLLDEMLEAPAPPALVILTQRDEETSDPLRALWRAKFLLHALVVDVHVAALSSADVAALVQAIAGRDHSFDAGAIALESGGSPYFAAEMIRHALEQNTRAAPAGAAETPTLGRTILARCENLPSSARRVLDALSVCEGPLPLQLLEAAIGLDDVELCVAALRSASFVRTRRLRDTPSVEPYHDRVREVIQRALTDSERRALHRGFARAFEEVAPHAWESLLHHSEGAGDFAKATLYAIRSAERASQAQAFEQAANLYRRALRHDTWNPDQERELYERLADALALCGHNAAAAEAYDRAASGNASADRIRLRMLTATQLLCSGNVLLGLERFSESIGYLGVEIPEVSEQFSRIAANLQQALVEASALRYRDEASADPQHLLRVDACWWAVKGLNSVYDPAAQFLASVHLLEAVRAGEPMRIARGAYAVAIAAAAPQLEDLIPIVSALMQIGDASAARAPSANTRFWRDYSLAMQFHFAFDVHRAAAHIEAAFEHASSGGHGLETEMAMLSSVEVLTLHSLFQKPVELGRSEIWKRDALRRGDRNLAAFMRTLDSHWWLTDTPEIFRVDLLALLAELSTTTGDDNLLVLLIHAVLASVERYQGLASEAFARTAPVIERVRASRYWTIPKTRADFSVEYLASAIAYAEQSRQPLPSAAEAVLSEFPVQGSGTIDMFRAGMAHLAGNRAEAIRLLERAEAEPGILRARMVVASARLARGRLLGGAPGRALVREALETVRAFGSADPERLLQSWCPGFRNA